MINIQNIGDQGSYKDLLELDGAFSVAHINYGDSPQFNGEDGKNIAKNSRRNSLSSMEHVEDVLASLSAMNGTEKNYKKADKIILWKNYWLEYVNAFDKLIIILPKSVVTAYIGRQAIEFCSESRRAASASESPCSVVCNSSRIFELFSRYSFISIRPFF